MLESIFELATPNVITESQRKYNYVVPYLPSAIVTMVWDVMMKTDTTDPYLKLKKKVVERCGESGTLKIRRMVAGESIADMKPN